MSNANLTEANTHFKAGAYDKALALYENAFSDTRLPAGLKKTLEYNISETRKRLALIDIDTEKRRDVPSNLIDKKAISTIASSELFDFKFFESQCHGKFKISSSSHSELIHLYIERGVADDLWPNRAFSPKQYLDLNDDVRRSGIDPFYHFLWRGCLESRKWLKKDNEQQHYWGFKFQCIQSQIISWQDLRTRTREPELISIVIPVYGQPDLLQACIESISTSQTSLKYEVIIVDNRRDESTSKAIAKIASTYKFVKVVTNKFNYNFSLGCNSGFAKCNGEVIVFLNSDTKVTTSWLEYLVSPLKEEVNIAATQPLLLYADGSVQTIGTVFSPWATMPFELYKGERADAPHINYSRYFQVVTAACMAVRASDFVDVRGFDPVYINGCEDIDLCLKLTQNSGKMCYYSHKSKVYHYEGKSPGRGKFNEINRMHFKNAWQGKINDDALDHFRRDNIVVKKWKLDNPNRVKRGINSVNPYGYEFIETEKPINGIYGSNCPFAMIDHVDEIDIHSEPGFTIVSKVRKFVTNNPSLLLVAHDCSHHIFGSERSFIDIAKALSMLSVNITICLPKAPSQEYISELMTYAHKVVIFEYSWWSKTYIGNRISVNKFKSAIQVNSVDIVYVNTIMPVDARVAARQLGIPLAIHVRELITDDNHLLSKFSSTPEELVNILYNQADVIVANSKATARMFPDSLRIFTAKNIVDFEKFSSSNVVNPARIFFGLISSNIPKKGIFDFFELARMSATDIPNAVFALVGPINNHIVEVVNSLDANSLKNILISGYINDSLQAINSVNVILSLSHFSESFGRTIAEGFAASRPAIGYKRGAVDELIRNHKTGILIKADSVDEAKNAVEFFCSNPSKIIDYGLSANQHVRTTCNIDQLSQNLARALSAAIIRKFVQDNDEFERLFRRLELQEDHSDHAATIEFDPPYFLSNYSQRITIIVPVFNALNELKDCIKSVFSHTKHPRWRLLVIDDCSTDQNVRHYLQNLQQHECVDVIYNETNIGYTKTVNKALKASANDNVILLNSDAEVTPNWLVALLIAGFKNKSIGTVTPMSNNAGAFSFPTANHETKIPIGFSREEFASLLCKSTCAIPDLQLPTGNGFCMLIKHSLIEVIGDFDEHNFPRGYGEENEFCMRALKHGFVNILTPSAFVYHIKTASFKGERTQLIKNGEETMKRMFPSYFKRVKKAFSSAEMLSLRQHIASFITSITNEKACN